MITVTGLGKTFGTTRALDSVSFSVSQGEILGFLGPNGAGKTTTIRILTGFLTPTEGEITINGINIAEKPIEARKHIGYLPENVPVHKEMTVMEYLNFVAGMKSVPGKDRQKHLSKIISSCGLNEVTHKLSGNLSKGYRQRLGLAQALIGDPDILILDEPTSGLDPRQIIEIRELIQQLRGERTIILSSHILPEVSNICDRVIIINQGKVAAVDSPENLESRLGQSRIVQIEIGGRNAIDELVRHLETLPGITRITVTSDKNPTETQTLAVHIESEADPRPLLAQQIIEAGWNLYDLHRESKSLEDIFMKLVTNQQVQQ